MEKEFAMSFDPEDLNPETKKLKELSKKYERCRCSQFCPAWDREGKACEIMGKHRLTPSKCRWFLTQKLNSGRT